MKKLLLVTAAIIGGVALPTLLLAGTTESITGCETAPAQGSNFTVFVDPTCPAQAKDGGDITSLVNEVFADLADQAREAREAAEEAAE
jgi:hypothetical protein